MMGKKRRQKPLKAGDDVRVKRNVPKDLKEYVNLYGECRGMCFGGRYYQIRIGGEMLSFRRDELIRVK